MRRLIIILLAVCGITQAQTDVTVRNKFAIVRGDSILVSGFWEAARIETPATVEVYDNLSMMDESDFDPLPESGWIEEGKLYAYGDEVVYCRQGHERTIYTPEQTPALFSFFREQVQDTLAWIRGEIVEVDWLRKYEGVTYKCIQQHMTQQVWEPDQVLGVLWVEVSTGMDCDTAEEWDSNQHWSTYEIGDLRTNDGKLWRVINVGYTYYEPSGTYGHYGWEFVMDCE